MPPSEQSERVPSRKVPNRGTVRYLPHLLTLVITVLLPQTASPCFCSPSLTSDCEHYWTTDAVFVGRVLRAEPKSVGEVRQRLFSVLPSDLALRLNKSWSAKDLRQALSHLLPSSEYASLGKASDDEIQEAFDRKFLTRHVRILVTEPFRGIEEREVEFTTDFSDCSVNFQENESYLIYAWRDQDTHQLRTGVCAGTNKIDKVPGQLKYIRGTKTGESLSQVFGFVTADPSDIQFRVRASKPIPGVPIVLQSGDKSWRTTTNAGGKYEIVGAPPGSYNISALVPNIPHEQTLRNFDLVRGACSRQNFLSVAVGSISGRLIDYESNPISGVLVELKAIPPTKQPHPLVQKLTDEQGKFEQQQLEAGEYVLGFNLTAPPNSRDWYDKRIPYPGSYYPGVTDRSAAQVLRLELGQNLEGLVFRVPPRLPQAIITGQVVWPDGSLGTASVWLMDLDFPPDSGQVDSAKTKPDGRFSLLGVAGRHYALFAHIRGKQQHVYSQVFELPQADGKPLHLVLVSKEAAEDCQICKRFTHLWQSPLWSN